MIACRPAGNGKLEEREGISMTRRLHPAIILAAVAALGAQTTSKENQVKDRGQTRTQDERETLDRGRFGSQINVPVNPITLSGVLVDAGCDDRSMLNLLRKAGEAAASMPPGDIQAQSANAKSQSASAHGITVDANTLDAERSDVLAHQVPDLRLRQQDPTCAITGSTGGFALLADSGRLLNLDEGGNTLAMQALQANQAGRAMLNGIGSAVKPRVSVTGRVHGDHLIVIRLRIRQ
jgi:hypothetical protein